MLEGVKIYNREVFYSSDVELNKYMNDSQEVFIKQIDVIEQELKSKDLKYFLGRRDIFQIIRDAWSFSSNYLIEKIGFDLLMQLIKMYYYEIMDDSEMEYIEDLDDTLTIYRGESYSRVLCYPGVSWTLNRDIAITYATNRNGCVMQGKINKNNIICLFFDEMEVLIEPGTVMSIDKININ